MEEIDFDVATVGYHLVVSHDADDNRSSPNDDEIWMVDIEADSGGHE